jgi:hypothetical protein
MKTERIGLDKIRIDGGTQIRVELDTDLVAEYQTHLADLPPSVVFRDGSNNWLADGFHRYFAHKRAGAKTMDCEVRQGTVKDAIKYALGCNSRNGKRPEEGDLRHALEIIMADPEWSKWSQSRIASELLHITQGYVSKLMIQVIPRNTLTDTVVGKDGKEYPRQAPKAKAKSTPAPPSGPAGGDEGIEPAGMDEDDFVLPDEPTETTEKAESKPEPLKDKAGQVIADPKLAALYQRRGELIEMMGQISAIKAKLIHGADDRDPLYAHISLAAAQAHCENLRRTLRFATPYAVCPYCGGLGCKVCKDTGLVGETTYENYTPEDLKV